MRNFTAKEADTAKLQQVAAVAELAAALEAADAEAELKLQVAEEEAAALALRMEVAALEKKAEEEASAAALKVAEEEEAAAALKVAEEEAAAAAAALKVAEEEEAAAPAEAPDLVCAVASAICNLKVTPLIKQFLQQRLDVIRADAQSSDNISTVNDLVLFELFNHHAAKGDATNAHVMSHNQFRKLLKELNVLRSKFTSAHADIMFKKFVAQEVGAGHKQQNISKSAQHQQHQGNDTKLEFSEFIGLINAIADEVAGSDKRQAFFNKKVMPLLDAVVTSVNAQKIAAPPRSVRSPGMNDDATEAPTIAKTKEALDKLPAINRNKKQLLQMYDFFANLNKQLDFKGLLAFAKAFDLMPGLFDMAQLQQMFHIVQQGAKSIDCLTKVRYAKVHLHRAQYCIALLNICTAHLHWLNNFHDQLQL